jgi:hypothetical protein
VWRRRMIKSCGRMIRRVVGMRIRRVGRMISTESVAMRPHFKNNKMKVLRRCVGEILEVRKSH